MAGFRKAKSAQAYLKAAIYGPAGSGKTLTSLLVAEELARLAGKSIAFVDTEHGTDFYAMDIPARKVHPKAFDFDALYSRSLTEVTNSVMRLDLEKYGVLVIDSMTHIWEAVMASYTGNRTKVGGIPIYAWGALKKPYKDMVTWLLNAPLHFMILGREGNEFDVNEEGEQAMVGKKFKAEGDTAYEPHILIKMEAVKSRTKQFSGDVMAYIEKDRRATGQSDQEPRLQLPGQAHAAVPGPGWPAGAAADRRRRCRGGRRGINIPKPGQGAEEPGVTEELRGEVPAGQKRA
jgi:hypothetical protein